MLDDYPTLIGRIHYIYLLTKAGIWDRIKPSGIEHRVFDPGERRRALCIPTLGLDTGLFVL